MCVFACVSAVSVIARICTSLSLSPFPYRQMYGNLGNKQLKFGDKQLKLDHKELKFGRKLSFNIMCSDMLSSDS